MFLVIFVSFYVCRGNSQYHYYGIRIKTLSPLNQISNDGLMTSRQHAFNQAKRYFVLVCISKLDLDLNVLTECLRDCNCTHFRLLRM
jgi:hypothetical protein